MKKLFIFVIGEKMVKYTKKQELKDLLKKSTNIGVVSFLLFSTISSVAYIDKKPVSAETNNNILKPGEEIGVERHPWTVADFTQPENFTPVFQGNINPFWEGNTYDFDVFKANAGSWLPFNGAVDMTEPIHISGTTYAWSPSSPLQLGDSNGIILTDRPSSELSTGTVGGSLGIGGLGSGSYFIGNDYSFNHHSLSQNYDTATVIAQGSGNGKKVLNNSSKYTPSKDETNHSPFEFTWKNPVLNDDDTVTGTISYTSNDPGGSHTATTSITVRHSMSIGFMAATGGNYSHMKVTIDEVQAARGTQPVEVNYMNTITGDSMAPQGDSWQNTTINSNVGETVGVYEQGKEGAVENNYFAPTAPSGYMLSEISDAITVENFQQEVGNPNQINVFYEPQKQSAKFNYSYENGSLNVPPLPSEVNVSGVTDQKLEEADTSLKSNLIAAIPEGYYVSNMRSEAGVNISKPTTDETLEAFFESAPVFDTDSLNNNYHLTLSPLTQTGQVSFIYDDGVPNDVPKLPENIPLSGVTGSELTFSVPDIPEGYDVVKVIGPDNIEYSSFEEALSQNNYYIPGNNDFKAIVSPANQEGVVVYQWNSKVPGWNNVEGKLQAELPNDLLLKGATGGDLVFSAEIPKGYGIDEVQAPDGKVYTDSTAPGKNALEAAQAANPVFIEGNNSFIISLKALPQDIKLDVSIDGEESLTPPEQPNTQVITTALTGAPINQNDINEAQSWLNNWMDNSAIGWVIKNYEDPKSQIYTDTTLDSVILEAGGLAFAEENTYIVRITYNGSISFVSIPENIDFGMHMISAKDQEYSGKLDNSLIVSDSRSVSQLTPWEVTLSQASLLMNSISYNDKIISEEPIIVYSENSSKNGEIKIIDKEGESPFKIYISSKYQAANTIFKGRVTWTLTNAP